MHTVAPGPDVCPGCGIPLGLIIRRAGTVNTRDGRPA
jgi:hypothetical protein